MPPAAAPEGQGPSPVAPLPRRASRAPRPRLTGDAGAGAAVPLINWTEDNGSSEAEEGNIDGWEADAAALPVEGISSDDPTLRLALALGLDPLLLPAAGGPGVAGSPAAGIKALRFALAHPASTPSLSAGPPAGGDHHLAMTASMLAKQRRKAGTSAGAWGGLEGGRDRVSQIDALLVAMRRRLRAVQAAMAADLAQAQEAEAKQQQKEQLPQQLGAIAEEAGSPRPAGEQHQQQPVQAGEQGAEGVTASAPAPQDGQAILALSTSGKHTQVHDLLVSVLAGLPAEAGQPASRSGARSPSPAATSRSGAAQGSPRLKRPSVVAAELHAFADALRERR